MNPIHLADKDPELMTALEKAIWADDRATLDRLAPCDCCCWEHTFLYCDARIWNGCRSGLGLGEIAYDERAWAQHYKQYHGMSKEEFYR